MPSKVTFALFDHGGAPLVGASPSVVVHGHVYGGSMPLPPIYEKGEGFYEFELDPGSDGPSAYLIDAGPESSTRYLSGSVGECIGFALYNEQGEPDSSRAPHFVVYRDSDGNDIPHTSFTGLTGGLYTFWPFNDLPGKSIYYVISDGLTTLSGTIGSTVVMNVDPAPDSVISSSQAITLDVLDSEAELGRVLISVEYANFGGDTELVWDGDQAVGHNLVTRQQIPGGWRYTVLRSGGWPGHPKLRVFVTNYGGRDFLGASYTLNTPVADYPYTLPDLFSDPPVTLNDLFKQLSYGELSDLQAGLDGAGNILSDRRNQVLHHANEGLRNLHLRFELLRVVQDVVVPVSDQPLLVPFPTYVSQVISMLTPRCSLSFHTVPVPGEIFVFNKQISFPPTRREYTVQVTFQKRHPVLSPITQDSDLLQPIYLSAELWPALRAYIAGEIYGNMNTVDAKNASREYRGRYAQICAEVEARGGTPQGMMDDQKFNMRGFV